MTTILFAHDGYVSLTSKGTYSDAYDNKIVERYHNIADNVVFMVRTLEVSDNVTKLNKITVENFSIKGIENFKSLRGILKYPKVIETVKREVRKADYIVARIPSDLGLLAAKYAKKYNKRYMIEVVGCPWDSLRNHSIFGKIIAPHYYLMQKKILKSAPYAIYVTNEFLQNRYPCSGKSIGCSDVEIAYDDETVLAKRIEKIKKTNMYSLVFGTMGALHMKYKGYENVIKALSELNTEGYSYKYLIVGSGDSSWLKSVIHKYKADSFVEIVSPMPHNKVFAWLDMIDVYIQPSKTEGMPRALIEAMSRACPCIGSDAGGIPELLDRDSIFKTESVAKLIQIINKLTNQILYSWANNNFKKAQVFCFEELYKHRLLFYKSFIKGKEQ